MIAESGHFALVLALLVAAVQGTLPLIGAWRGYDMWVTLARPAATAQFLLITYAFAVLTYAFVVSDFSVAAVFANSHSAKPMLYKVTGVWGNHEGSLLLWILILAVFGFMVAAFGGNLPARLRARVLSVQGLIGVGFLLFILFTSNPFARIDPAPLDGRGLNPLLQDPGLAFHPPFLYLGYVGLSIAFSFAVAALIEGRVDPAWARWVRPWTLLAWCFLTVGIALGSWWAYYELGWGGWWFWDPVENASFMPWLAATALLHSAVVVEKREALKSWTILLAILAFSLSLLGTFLVRSGVLNSVHAFASDPTRGVFILAFLVLVVGGSLTLYAVRAPALAPSGFFRAVSREGSLVLNNAFLVVIAGVVLLGTLYPLFADALLDRKVSVGGPYFNFMFILLITPLLIAMAAGPLLAWKRGDLVGAATRLKWALIAALVLSAMTWVWLADGPLLALLGMALGGWLLTATLMEWAGRVKLFQAPLGESLRRARGLPRAAHGMTIAHLGVALVIFGITASETWTEERLMVVKPGDVVTVGGFDMAFVGAEPVQGPNYTALRGHFRVTTADGGAAITDMFPEARTYQNPPMETTEAAIRPTPAADLYAVIGESDGEGGYGVRLYHKPLVSWIWLGSLVMVAGGFVSLSDRRLRVGVPAKARTAAAGDTVRA